jgi:leader peptidase (prepilin peptidase)/N-methyltransferase
METIQFIMEHPELFLFLVAALSLIIGSFLNVVIYRLPLMMKNEWSQECREYLGLKAHSSDIEKLNLYRPFSHCTHCKKPLKLWHNIPIISYLVLRGKCAFCGAKISMRYPFVELLCCVASVYVAWRFGMSWQTAGGLLFTWILISLVFIDLDHHLLPDQLTLLLLWIGLLLSLFSIFANSQDAIIGAVAGYLIFAIVQGLFKMVTGKIGMGQGDYKFLAGLGAFLGWQQLPMIILLASIIGLLFGVVQMVIRNQFKSVPIPFGPYLAVAGWISLMWGPQILNLYINKFLN